MRDFNASGKGPIQLWGLDIGGFVSAMSNVRKFVAAADPEFLPSLENIYREMTLPKYQFEGLNQHNEFQRFMMLLSGRSTDGARVCRLADDLLSHLEKSRKDYQRKTPIRDIDWGIQNARLIRQFVGWLSMGMHPFEELPLAYRDQCMAENTSWILDQTPPGSKLVLWAHNGHVTREAKQMGQHLADRYVGQMVVLGFTCHEGRYTAYSWPRRELEEFPITPSVAGSLEWRLHELGLPAALIDLRGVSKTSPASAWLSTPISIREIGNTGTTEQFRTKRVVQDFDACRIH